MKYHRPDCSGYRDMAEANRVFFKTVAEAEAAGYKRAGNCPAAVQVVTSKSTSGLHIVNPAPSSTAPVSYPEVSASSLMVDPMLTPKVTGHRKTKVYSLPGCSDFAQGSTHVDLVVFGSVEDAEKAGYKLAANCAGRKTSKATSTVSMPPQ
jgi:methylphosphotriester-DNA--protein-cysteine methyltransferase